MQILYAFKWFLIVKATMEIIQNVKVDNTYLKLNTDKYKLYIPRSFFISPHLVL